MTPNPSIILASSSQIRAAILLAAGVRFDVIKPGVDEEIIKNASAAKGKSLEDTAMALAEAKCMAVASTNDGIVVGSDQIMEFEGRAYDKPKSMDEARARLLQLSGAKHSLINAVAVARNGDIIWRHIDRPVLTMRAIEPDEVDRYLEAAGPDILHSVGAYQVEKLGARLFERIDGDQYAVLGLSLFPLLALLRREKVLDF